MTWTRAGAVLACAGMLLAVTASAAAASGPPSRPWQSSAAGSTHPYGSSIVIHNNFSSGHQTIWADSGTHWGVNSQQATDNKTPSYPDLQVLEFNPVAAMPILQGKYQLSQPAAGNGKFVAAYDMRIQNNGQPVWSNATQVQVWVDNQGDTPAGNVVGHGKIYGKSFTFYSTGEKLQAGATYTLVFQPSPGGTTHLAKIFTWLEDNGWISQKAEDLDVEFGWQIRSTNDSNATFDMKSFVVRQPGSSPLGAGIVAPRTPWPLIVGLAAVFLAVFGLALLLLGAFTRSGRRRTLTERIEKYGPRHSPVVVEQTSHSAVGGAAVDAVSRLMGPATRERLSHRLDLAGISRKPAEWAVLGCCLAVVIAAMLSLVTSYVLIGVLGGSLVGWLTMRLSLSLRILRRRASFSEQLPDLLQLIASALHSGFSLPQAFDAVVREDTQPAAGEFARALAEARLGANLEDALDSVANRMDSDDMRWTVLAIRIQQGVGGNLAEVLLTIAGTIRERAFLRRQIGALSAEGRLSAWILVILPVLVAAWLFISSPAYMRLLYTTTPGELMLLFAVVLLLIGALWMRRTIKVEV